MKKIIGLIVSILILSCAVHDEEKIWDNPLDPEGVDWHPPIVTPVNDTVVSQTDTVLIKVVAIDENGSIEKYYWDTGVDGWDDSTYAPQHNFSKPDGGLLSLVWGARDDDNIIRTDTFTILFNRHPVSVEMVEPADGDTAVWDTFYPMLLSGKY